ncbi:hypothetical protein ABGB07_32715 [Micromonosporaceae bacterium B7E4]
MLVEVGTIAMLEGLDVAGRRLFVAGCAERMAQLFTGIRGVQDWRSHDVEVFIASLDELWGGSVAETCEDLLREVERFEEFGPSEEGVSDTADIYAAYSALALRYALSCVVRDNPTFAIKCGHVILTAMGQMDRAVSSDLFEEERRFQARYGVAFGNRPDPQEFRQECQESARRRLEILLSRL